MDDRGPSYEGFSINAFFYEAMCAAEGVSPAVELASMRALAATTGEATARWLQSEASIARAREAEYEAFEGVSGLWPSSDSSSSSGDESEGTLNDWCCLFSVRRYTWRSLEYCVSDAATGHGDAVWASAEYLATRVLNGNIDVAGLRVLECGAGAGLPSITCARQGASVVATDAPTAASIFCLALSGIKHGFSVRPLRWGDSLDQLFDLILAADCIYDPASHVPLLTTMKCSLKPTAQAIVAFAFHGNAPDAAVLHFFALAQQYFVVRYLGVSQHQVTDSMRERCCVDASSLERARVHTYILTLGVT